MGSTSDGGFRIFFFHYLCLAVKRLKILVAGLWQEKCIFEDCMPVELEESQIDRRS